MYTRARPAGRIYSFFRFTIALRLIPLVIMIITPLGVSFHYSLYQKRKSLTPVVNYKIPRSLARKALSRAVIFVGDTLLLPYLAFRVAQPTISHAVRAVLRVSV